MEKISQCFKVMGKSDEANEIEEEISKLFDSDLKATHLLTDDQNLDSFAANAEPESMLKKMSEIAEQVLQPQIIVHLIYLRIVNRNLLKKYQI